MNAFIFHLQKASTEASSKICAFTAEQITETDSATHPPVSELPKYPAELRNWILKGLQLLWPLSDELNRVLLPPALGRGSKTLRVGRLKKPGPQAPSGNASLLGFIYIGSEFTRPRKKARTFHPLLYYAQSSWLATGVVLGYILCANTAASIQVNLNLQENEMAGFHCKQTKTSITSMWLNLL